MQLILSKNIMSIFRRALNLIDFRLVDHCERVAYIVFKMLKEENKYTDQEIVKLCFLTTLHDIGAYKTEDIDVLTDKEHLISFEVNETISHCAYGYLFVKKFSILSKYADAILFHHSRYDSLSNFGCENKELAAKIFLADRIDILTHDSDFEITDDLFSDLKDTVFLGDDIDLFINIEKIYKIKDKLQNGKYLEELFDFYDSVPLSKVESTSFLRTLIYSIDFRSEFTVMHTITTVAISMEIAKLMNIKGIALQKIYYGSLLHDIGKISTPLAVLEKTSKLTDKEFEIMKDHVSVSESILTGCIDDETLQIAIRHHEKHDGSGYPHGLTGDVLTESERIVCVADVMSALSGKRSYKNSFPENTIKNILQTMADKNKLCKKTVEVVLQNYTFIMSQAAKNCQNALKDYSEIHEEYKVIYNKYKD